MSKILDEQEVGSKLFSSTNTLKLITRGRRTGLPHIVRLRFATLDGQIYVLAGSRKSDWFLNSLHSGSARVKIGDILYDVSVSEGDRKLVINLFRKKYGQSIVSSWYQSSEGCLSLQVKSARRAVSGETDVRKTFDEWRKEKEDYYSSVARAFDSASEEYDFTISHNYINSWIRRRSISTLLSLAKEGDILLEIGCGTGEEAIKIAGHVKKIVATDISAKMIELVNLKVKAKGLDKKIIPFRIAASDIAELEHILGGELFDLAYSFNGCLNCEPNLGRFSESLSRLLKSSAYFICSIRNPVCASEMLSHLLILQPRKSTPRKHQPTMVSVGGMDVPAFYYTPDAFVKNLEPRFRPVKFFALPAILPPAYLSDYYIRMGRLTSLVERVEPLLSDKKPFSLLGDQTLFIFQKV